MVTKWHPRSGEPRSQRSGAVSNAQTQTKGFLMSASTIVLAALERLPLRRAARWLP